MTSIYIRVGSNEMRVYYGFSRETVFGLLAGLSYEEVSKDVYDTEVAAHQDL